MSKVKKCSPETREWAVRLVLEHMEEYSSQWAAIESIAEKIGCTPQTLRTWVLQAERDAGRRPGLNRDDEDTLLGIVGLFWLVLGGAVIVAGWKGHLPGARNRAT